MTLTATKLRASVKPKTNILWVGNINGTYFPVNHGAINYATNPQDQDVYWPETRFNAFNDYFGSELAKGGAGTAVGEFLESSAIGLTSQEENTLVSASGGVFSFGNLADAISYFESNFNLNVPYGCKALTYSSRGAAGNSNLYTEYSTNTKCKINFQINMSNLYYVNAINTPSVPFFYCYATPVGLANPGDPLPEYLDGNIVEIGKQKYFGTGAPQIILGSGLTKYYQSSGYGVDGYFKSQVELPTHQAEWPDRVYYGIAIVIGLYMTSFSYAQGAGPQVTAVFQSHSQSYFRLSAITYIEP